MHQIKNLRQTSNNLLISGDVKYPMSRGYAYTYTDVKTNNIFYVGKGYGKRVYDHIYTDNIKYSNNNKKEAVLNALNAHGIKITIYHHRGSDERLMENALIVLFKSVHKLTNVSSMKVDYGYSMSPQTEKVVLNVYKQVEVMK